MFHPHHSLGSGAGSSLGRRPVSQGTGTEAAPYPGASRGGGGGGVGPNCGGGGDSIPHLAGVPNCLARWSNHGVLLKECEKAKPPGLLYVQPACVLLVSGLAEPTFPRNMGSVLLVLLQHPQKGGFPKTDTRRAHTGLHLFEGSLPSLATRKYLAL